MTDKTYVNYGMNENVRDGYRVACVDRFGSPLVWFRGYYNHRTSEFTLYPHKVVVPGAIDVGIKKVSAFNMKSKK